MSFRSVRRALSGAPAPVTIAGQGTGRDGIRAKIGAPRPEPVAAQLRSGARALYGLAGS